MALKRIGIVEQRRGKRLADPLPPRLLTIKQGAQYTGLTIWAMRERIWAGQIPVVRFPQGRKIYIDRVDLDSFIEENKSIYR